MSPSSVLRRTARSISSPWVVVVPAVVEVVESGRVVVVVVGLVVLELLDVALDVGDVGLRLGQRRVLAARPRCAST